MKKLEKPVLYVGIIASCVLGIIKRDIDIVVPGIMGTMIIIHIIDRTDIDAT